jgi:putative membrane protein
VKSALKKNKDYLSLLGALTSIADGVGTRADTTFTNPKTLLQAINAVAAGMKWPGPDSELDCYVAATGADPKRCGVIDALSTLSTLLQTAATVQVENLRPHVVAVYASSGCAGPIGEQPVQDDPTEECDRLVKIFDELFRPLPDGESPIFGGVQIKFLAAAQSLERVIANIQSELLAPGEGLDQIRQGLSNPKAGDCAKANATATEADDCGIREAVLYLRDLGIPSLVDGITANVRTQLIEGIGVPTAGCDPTSTLRCAAAALADGGGQLSDGAQQLADGTGQASDGAGQLADGLGTAADGSERLADGLSQAEEGAPKLVDGAGRLSTEGMSQLIAAGEDTAQDYGKLYATIKAGADRADAEKMAYGAPEGAQGLTAYSYELLGDDGQGSRNTKRGVAALALLGVGAGGLLLRRRLL